MTRKIPFLFVAPVLLLASGPLAAGQPDDKLMLYTAFVAEQDVPGGWKEKAIRDNDVLESGDGVKIFFEPNRDAHVYVLMLDSAGKAQVLFPAPGDDARVAGGTMQQLPPGQKDWFFLDQSTGRETLYVLARLEPLTDLAPLLATLEAFGPGREDALADQAVVEWVRDPVKRKKRCGKKKKSKDCRKRPPPKPMLIAGVVRGIKVVGKTKPIQVPLTGRPPAPMQAQATEDRGAVVRAVSFIHR